jgi:hypothetical protein
MPFLLLSLLALSLSHPAIKNLLARLLLSTWSLLGPTDPTTTNKTSEVVQAYDSRHLGDIGKRTMVSKNTLPGK